MNLRYLIMCIIISILLKCRCVSIESIETDGIEYNNEKIE